MIPYFDATRQYQSLKKDLERAILKVAASGQYVLGSTVEEFETTFADYIGTKLAFGVGSGTDALIFSLRVLGIGKGDEVIVPSFTFMATVFSILHVGATPVFAEVNAATYTLDPAGVEKLITKKTKAILPVHLYGHPADMTGLMAIAKKHKLAVVEDTCQSHGATWKGKKAGSFGDAGCFSFYPTKNLGAMGDGGIITTNHSAWIEPIKRQRNLGRTSFRDQGTVLGNTSRLDAMQAAILSVKLKHLETFTKNRRLIADIYRKNLASAPLILPVEAPGAKHVYHLFVVRVPDGKREALQEALAKKNISTLVHYPRPVHEEPICRELVKKKYRLPLTEKLCTEILSLPMFPEMREEEVLKVCSVIKQFFA